MQERDGGPSLAEKEAFLSSPAAYPAKVAPVGRRETHMSWVFFVDDRVYKLKKPARLPYLDFSTLARREAACRAEVRLNRRLAPDVYLGLEPLVATPGGLAIGGAGEVVDWLVVMRRLDLSQMLDERLDNHVQDRELDRLAAALASFYRHAERCRITPARHLAEWRAALEYNRRVLLDPRLGMPGGLVRRIDAVQRRFMRLREAVLIERVRRRRILDAHGDLRPEHIWLGDPVKIIDCLEFSASLRANDPLDEIAFLDLECERLGAPEAGRRLVSQVTRRLPDDPGEALYLFYRCHRAMLRARLSIAHLLEPEPRTPQKWPRQARLYLILAARDARRLERLLRTPEGR
jgi:aminoglycoside phosphotransferase family enzyme